jgi:hypothetical protein
MKGINRTLVWVTIYAIAMGALEAAVVIYLRRLYFPEGFKFPLWTVQTDVTMVELWREAATILMLVAIGALAGRKKGERFAYFVFAFAVWDLVYYAVLKLALNWPESLLTWDLLFLLPVPWISPVLAPCIVAVTMIVFSVLAINAADERDVHLDRREKALLWVGSLIIIFSFTVDWVKYEGPIILDNIAAHRRLDAKVGSFVPTHYPWWIFLVGEAVLLIALVHFHRRIRADSSPA